MLPFILFLSLLVCSAARAADEPSATNITTNPPNILQIASIPTPLTLLFPGIYDSNDQHDTQLSSETYSYPDAADIPTGSSKPLMTLTGTPAGTTDIDRRTALPGKPTANAQPCNGHIEFCNRRFSNISMVVAHNSPFAVQSNMASNQENHVLKQLNDGIRGLSFPTHWPEGFSQIELCHNYCYLLDAGTLESYLETVERWLSDHQHRYEVLALFMGNDDRLPPTDYIAPFRRSGMLKYVYTPPKQDMKLEDWPTLSEMILHDKRVVVMLDYKANQTEVPWLLDEFSHQWQTKFSPTDPSFPCTVDRPNNQAKDISEQKLYMANHNLNVPIDLSSYGASADPILMPARQLLPQVNAASGNMSLGTMADDCVAVWNRPPNWLLVDYYNYGDFNGSVFQVAATANNVSYNRASCCGADAKSDGGFARAKKGFVVVVAQCVVMVILVLM